MKNKNKLITSKNFRKLLVEKFSELKKTLTKVLRKKLTIDSINDCLHKNELVPCFLGKNRNKGHKSEKKADIYQKRTISFRIKIFQIETDKTNLVNITTTTIIIFVLEASMDRLNAFGVLRIVFFFGFIRAK